MAPMRGEIRDELARNEEPRSPVDIDLDAPLPVHTPLEEWIRMHPDEAKRMGFLSID